MKEPTYHAAIAALTLWGRAIRGGSPGLGWPKTNTIGRLMVEGAGASQSTAPTQVIDLPGEIAVVSQLLAHLDDEKVDAVWLRFARGKPEREAAVALNVSRNELRRRLQAATWYIAGAIEARKGLDAGGPARA